MGCGIIGAGVRPKWKGNRRQLIPPRCVVERQPRVRGAKKQGFWRRLHTSQNSPTYRDDRVRGRVAHRLLGDCRLTLPRQNRRMGRDRNQSTTPDLFSTAFSQSSPPQGGPPSSASGTDLATTAPSPRHILPRDLPSAIKNLSDHELDQLRAVVFVELQRRGRKPPSNENISKRRDEEVTAPLTVGKLNAIRAAFKAGITPSRIARQFGVSQSDVRKALAGNTPGRSQLGRTTTSDVES
jgi:hypothetical protein